MPRTEKTSPDKPLTTGRVKQIAAGIAVTGALLGGLNLLNSHENPVRTVPRIENLDESNFDVSGAEQHPEVGEGLFSEGQEVSFLDELDRFDLDSEGHLRNSPVVNSGGNGDPGNDVRFEGQKDTDAAYLSRPVISPDPGPNPNGTALVTLADGHENFVYEAQARDVEALQTVQSYPGVNGATNIRSGIVKEIHENGMLVQPVDENGRPEGDTLLPVAVTRIGSRNLEP